MDNTNTTALPMYPEILLVILCENRARKPKEENNGKKSSDTKWHDLFCVIYMYCQEKCMVVLF
jgi:hypothetical protein